MPKTTDFTFLSTDGTHTLHAMIWEPTERPITAVLQIAHGVAEHISRYDEFARFLCEQGIAVVGHDHLGHGESLVEGDTPVYFGDNNTWQTVVDDIYSLHLHIKERFPDVPLFLMGHSMGSFLVRTYLIRYPGTVKGAIIMGTGWQNELTLSGGILLANIVARCNGADSTSSLITKLAFGAYNKPFSPNRTPYDWLSADEDNVDRYMEDPMCGADATAALFIEMLRGFRFNQNKNHLRKMDIHTPLLLVSGSQDPVGAFGKGVELTYAAFEQVGIKDLSVKLYDGLRHEILNEKSQQANVYQDIAHWLNAHILPV